jgi:hypothetical protein
MKRYGIEKRFIPHEPLASQPWAQNLFHTWGFASWYTTEQDRDKALATLQAKGAREVYSQREYRGIER